MKTYTSNSARAKKNLEKNIKQAYKINRLLLCSHAGLFLLFLYLKVTLMVYVNIGSIVIYLAMFYLCKKNVIWYIELSLLEVLIHMSLATISVGWDAGFQFYSFCLIPCIFLCDYLAQTDHHKTMHPIGVSMIIIGFFLLCRWYCVTNNALYVLDRSIEYAMLFTYNLVISFTFLIIYLLLFERRILSKERLLENMAEMDELTQLPNRYLMQSWLTDGFAKAKVKHPMAVAMIDVDNFKQLNDNYGHNCGDYVLQSIASQIQRHMEDSLYAARWGGEEFLFLDTSDNALEHLLAHLQELQNDLAAAPLYFQNQKLTVTMTIGVTKYKKGDETFFDTIERADEYMYQGKKEGKNRILSDQ